MKYIVLEVTDTLGSGKSQRELPIIFPNHLVHLHVAQAITKILRAERPDGRLRQIRPVAAGELSSMSFEGECSGHSATLNLNSRGEQDDQLIHMHDYLHGIC